MDPLYIKKGFDLVAMKVTANKPEQRAFLLSHPKRKIAEENVSREIKTASLRMGQRFKRKQLDQLIQAGAELFFSLAISAKIKDLMTAAELARHVSKAGEIADTQNMVSEWEKESLSTAVTKAVPGLRDAASQSERDEHQLGGAGSNGNKILSTGRDPQLPGAN